MKKGLKMIFVLAIIFISTFSLTFKTKADNIPNSNYAYYQDDINEYISFQIYDYLNYFRVYLIALDNYIDTDTTNKINVSGTEEFGTNDSFYPPLTFVMSINELTQSEIVENYTYYYFDIYKNQLTSSFNNIFVTFNNLTYVDSATTQIENNVSFSIMFAYNTYQKGFDLGYENGYDNGRRDQALEGDEEIFNRGYEKGQQDLLNAITPKNFMDRVMESVTYFLNIQILPNITIGGIILIPLALNLVIIIIKILKKH